MTDWQPGDIALCVKHGKIVCEVGDKKCYHCGTHPGIPPLMAVRTVAHVRPAISSKGNIMECGCYELHFTDGSVGLHKRFVKVTPGADIEGKEVERKVPKRVPLKIDEGIRA